MGELYNPYPKLPKNIRQIGERDQILKLYVEDYVNTYLKRLFPVGGQDLRVGLLLGEMHSQEGMPYLFVDGALEMEGVTQDGEKVAFTEEAWKKAYQTMEQMFPRRNVLGWFLCGAPGSTLSPLNYWKQHGQYFSAKNQLMYLNSGLEGEEALYIASEDSFYKLRGYCIYYEKNQMMQDYMVSRKDAHRVESGAREPVIQDFRQKLQDKRVEIFRRRSAVSRLGTVCGVLSVLVLASGVTMFNNYHKMREMESVIASVMPEGEADAQSWAELLLPGKDQKDGDDVEVEQVPGEIYPTLAEIVIGQEDGAVAAGVDGQAGSGATGQAGGNGEQVGSASGQVGGNSGSGATGQAGGSSGQVGGGMSGQAGGNSGSALGQFGGTGGQVGSASGQVGGNSAAGQAGTGGNGGQNSGSTSGQAGGSSSSGSMQPAEPVQVPSDAVKYVVKNGETLYGICIERYGSMADMDNICRWNGLGDGSHIMAGQELLVPPTDGD